jgi:hypothetical protein
MNKKEILDWLAGHQDQELFQEAAAVTERSCGSHVYTAACSRITGNGTITG